MSENDFINLSKAGDFEIAPVQPPIDMSSRQDFKKLDTGEFDKMQLSAAVSQLPSLMAANAMSNSYFLEFPKGVQGTLMKLKRGGYSTTLVDENHHFTGTASLHQADGQALALGIFSVMAAVSGQYFLKEINNNFRMMKMELDKILEFLYGDKKAELLSEMSFVKYAYQNFSSIMAHDSQRLATIISLQEARKVAMKDIEFYTGDLDRLSSYKGGQQLDEIIAKAFKAKDSLELSVQLCAVSNILEVYYAENYDANYIQYVENDLETYLDKLEKHLLGSFAAIGQMIQARSAKGLMKKPVDDSTKDEVVQTVEVLKNGGGDIPFMRSTFHDALAAPMKKQTFCVSNDGSLYLKTA